MGLALSKKRRSIKAPPRTRAKCRVRQSSDERVRRLRVERTAVALEMGQRQCRVCVGDLAIQCRRARRRFLDQSMQGLDFVESRRRRTSPLFQRHRHHPVPEASGSRQTSFSHGGVTVKVAWESAAIGSSGIRWTRRPGVKRLPRGSPVALPAWLPPETRSRWVSGPQPLGWRTSRSSARSLRKPMPASEPQSRSCRRVVVAVVGGGALVGGAVGIDADLDRFPIVLMFAGVADDRHAAERRRVRVEEPVLEIEAPRPLVRAVVPRRFAFRPRRRPAVDDVDERGDRQALVGAVDEAVVGRVAAFGFAAAAVVDRHRPRAVLEADRRHVLPRQPPDFVAVGGDQQRLVAAAVGELDRAEDPRRHRPRQVDPRNRDPRRQHPDQEQADDADHPDPLDRPLSSLATHGGLSPGGTTYSPR